MSDLSGGKAAEIRHGQIVTFYSYKGGTGRTMALANIAWILAANGHRVLVADWDLESPGLHRFFHPFLEENAVRGASGIIDLIREYVRAAASDKDGDQAEDLIRDQARVQRHALSLDWAFPEGGGLDFLSAGRQNLDYSANLASADWDNFYHDLNGGVFLDSLRNDMKQHYDYVLIDSRTGLGDVASICTVQLPDVLVDCFTLSIQGLQGASETARIIREQYPGEGIRILPVPMRVDDDEMEKVDAGRAEAVQLFADLPAGMDELQRRKYWADVEVPYKAFYAYEETLAVFGDPPGSHSSLLSSFERLVAYITNGAVTDLPRMEEKLRIDTKQLFTRKPPPGSGQVTVEFSPEDQLWGEWIVAVLHEAGLEARARHLDADAPVDASPAAARTLTVVSSAYAARHRVPPARSSGHDLAVYIAPVPQLPGFSPQSSAFVAGVPEREACERLYRLIGITSRQASAAVRAIGNRYPGAEPKIFRAPARNPLFTGREQDLRRLRGQLREHGTTVVLPLALQGLGGIGKTQLALEYVHRFKTDYDLVRWIHCGQPQFIDASLVDLGEAMEREYGIGPLAANAAEGARQVLQLLSRGEVGRPWLLVYDNAEDIDQVARYLPAGNGHVLITSREPAWTGRARSLPVELFTREESVAHLRRRAPMITADEADRVAAALGDLPVAVASVGAYLADPSRSVAGYLQELEAGAPDALSKSEFAEYPQPVSQIWGPPLDLLQERSPAAARLFQLCSVTGPRIATDLLDSEIVARLLERYDPALSVSMVIGRLIHQIDDLALIKFDPGEKRIHVHVLVQAVVRSRMSADELVSTRHDVHQILSAARPRGDVDNPDTWERFRLIWPHLDPSRAVTSEVEGVRQLFIDRVRYIWRRHDLERGREAAAEVEAAWEMMLAEKPAFEQVLRRQLLQLRFNLGNILRDMAHFEEARDLDRAVLAEQQTLLGSDHPHTLMTAGSLAADLRALGLYDDALRMDKETYPAWGNLYGESHPRTLAAANNLAVSYRLTGDIVQAQQVDEQTLERRRETLGATHPWTLSSASSVARDLLEAGRYAEATTRIEVVRELCVKSESLGPNSLEALNAQVLLGVCLRSSGRPGDAEPNFTEASDGLSRQFGATSSDALAARLSQAVNWLSVGRPIDAEAAIRQVLEVYEQRLGAQHPHTLVCLVNLADAQRLMDQPAAALGTIRRALDGLRTGLGPEHPYTLAAMMLLAVLLASQGDLTEAGELEEQTYEGLVHTLGIDHPDTLRCQANLQLTRDESGMVGSAEERVQTIAQLAVLIGADHPDIGTLSRQGRLMRALDPAPF